MALENVTPWVFKTSQETSQGIAVIGGEGKLYFENTVTGEQLILYYSFLSVGVAKGATLNYSEALKSDPSGATSNVIGEFGPGYFPCWGNMLVFGATAGIFQPSFMSHSGASFAMAEFGVFSSFARIGMWGRFNSLLPSAGPSLAFCHFEIVQS